MCECGLEEKIEARIAELKQDRINFPSGAYWMTQHIEELQNLLQPQAKAKKEKEKEEFKE